MLSLAVTAPLFGPGYLLLRDAVSTPRSYLSDAALGLGEAAPRALPQDFAVALLSSVIDGGVAVKLLLAVGLWLAGWGAARLSGVVIPNSGMAGQFVAATLAIWNPYVAERLLQGHWSLIVGYGCLPWVAAAMLRLRQPEPGWADVGVLAFWVALAGLTPTGLMLAASVAVTCVFAPGQDWPKWRCAVAALGTALIAALPWLSAAVVASSLAPSQAEGVAAFAARAEPGLGTLPTLASLGGIWNSEAVPASRTTLFAVVAAVVLIAIVALGLPVAIRNRAAAPLLILAALAVVVPALMATGPGLAAVEAIARALPGLGVLRDAQKWVALAVPGYALAGAAAVVTLRRGPLGLPGLPAVAAALVCCAALIATLPDLVWGVGGRVTPVEYPPGWAAATAMINDDPRPVAVLPVDSMRHFEWAGDAPVLDPLPRWVRADVLSTGDLTIGGRTVPGEGERARTVQQMLLDGADRYQLAGAGVGWVVVESGGAADTLALPIAYQDDDITLYRVGGELPRGAGRGVVLAAQLAWLALLLGGLAALVRRTWVTRTLSRGERVSSPHSRS